MQRPTAQRPDHPALLGLLGICPLLAGSGTLVAGLTLGVATLLVLGALSAVAAILGPARDPAGATPGLLVMLAALTSAVGLACQALFHELYFALGLFLPLLMVNFTVIRCAAQVTPAQALPAALRAALAAGSGMLALLVAAGGLRQLLAPASLLAAAPAGGFFALALVIVIANAALGRRPAAP